MTGSLTAKRLAFVDEYLVDLNATQAAIRAGYSAKTAIVIANQLMAVPEIKAAIAARQQARVERTEITQDYVLQRLKAEAEYCGEGASHGARVSALNLLGKHVGMFVERLDVKHSVDTERDALADRLVELIARRRAAADSAAAHH